MQIKSEKSYDKLISYVKEKILNKDFVVGDRLPSERVLANTLNISRNSVREGIRLLDRVGVVSSQQGVGNFISNDFDRTMTEVMSMMYVLNGMNMEEITDFRFGLEYGALDLAVKNIDDEQKDELEKILDEMENTDDEVVKARLDKKLHYLIVEASKNSYMISTFSALNQIMERYVPEMREKIFSGMKSEIELENSHRKLVESIVSSDIKGALDALFMHFKYIRQFLMDARI